MIGVGVRMLARARLRCRLLVGVLNERGEYRMRVGDYAFVDDELRGGQADCLGDIRWSASFTRARRMFAPSKSSAAPMSRFL
jgi:hypothetical protein